MQVSSKTLGAKVLKELGTNETEMIFGKRIKIKSRVSGLLSYQTRIRNKLGFNFEGDTLSSEFSYSVVIA